MNAMTVQEVEQNLARLITRVIADAEPTIVISETGEQVVMLPLDEYTAWKETLCLLANPANARHIHTSIAEAQSGHIQERELLDI